VLNLLVGEVIFTVLISEFKLRGFSFAKSFFKSIKFVEISNEGGALIIVTFIDRAIFAMLPKIKSMITMRAPEFSFASKAMMDVKKF